MILLTTENNLEKQRNAMTVKNFTTTTLTLNGLSKTPQIIFEPYLIFE